ncbi:PstS family phosphate ABC transporter substrate-binding protein [Ornithinimicrobium cryptoxanthini]|uniref:Phosphate-binding protein n=1 Tax=Ornithinimicrobium cryptoxanthini TaxID=2934161 RepID=A0ABY4YIQ4_9MICO|nr:PstS family phosphate ABC transporter substrate-binding protein [Ornithinimicrobium cryptoxanthini]USQ76657.1 PstS family phosphate ABC transporter substrate-binding protein [Ornithinimicrobium cryptoxanthini]
MSVRRMSMARASVAALVAITLAACGSDDDGDNGTEDQPAAAEDDGQAAGGESEEGGSEGGELSGDIAVDGSSTVTPLTEAAAELFMNENPDVRIAVGTSGTGGGFDKFCNGETDVSMASREVKQEEIDLCAANGVEFEELGVANDGLAIVVNPANDWTTCITVEEINAAWKDGSTATTWADINSDYPDEALELYGPGTDSGTFDYFTEAINGEEGNITQNYNDIGEDDNAAVIGVSGSTGAMAFIPLSYVTAAGDQVKAIEVENEAGECVAPSEETVQAGDYNPLGRQLFIYPSAEALKKPEVLAFVEFHVENSGPAAEAAGFIGLTEEQAQEALDKVASLTGGR